MKREQLEQTLQQHLGSFLAVVLVGLCSFAIGSHYQSNTKEDSNSQRSNFSTREAPSTSAVIKELETTLATNIETAELSESADTANEVPVSIEGRINVNTASQSELEELPGVGPTKAKAIIEYRRANGPFITLNDLGNVSGIGPKSLESLKDKVSF